MIPQMIEARQGKNHETRLSTRPRQLMQAGKGCRSSEQKKTISCRKWTDALDTRRWTRSREKLCSHTRPYRSGLSREILLWDIYAGSKKRGQIQAHREAGSSNICACEDAHSCQQSIVVCARCKSLEGFRFQRSERNQLKVGQTRARLLGCPRGRSSMEAVQRPSRTCSSDAWWKN